MEEEIEVRWCANGYFSFGATMVLFRLEVTGRVPDLVNARIIYTNI
jgi:hypothetical protein